MKSPRLQATSAAATAWCPSRAEANSHGPWAPSGARPWPEKPRDIHWEVHRFLTKILWWVQWPFQDPEMEVPIPYIRPIFQAYTREYTPKYGLTRHSTSVLGSLGSPWWVVSEGLKPPTTLLIFHNIWDVILPIDELMFFGGVGIPPTSSHWTRRHSHSIIKTGDVLWSRMMV